MRFIEYIIWFSVVVLLLSKASDYLFWTDYYVRLTHLPAVASIFDLDDGYDDVDFDDMYYKQFLGVLEQITQPQNIKNITVKIEDGHTKIFKIRLNDNTRRRVIVLFTGGEYKIHMVQNKF